ncbi:MAG: protein kinase [Planctomycetota bacterium]
MISSDDAVAMRGLDEAQQQRLSDLLEAYLSALDSGLPPSVESLTADDPDLRAAMQQCIGGIEQLHRMAAGEDARQPSIVLAEGDQQLGDFILHEEIGRGGMGVVYRATQQSLRRSVAVKLLPIASVLDPRQVTRFRHEAEAAASLQHPNIVPVFAVGCERGTNFYAMRLIEGRSLDEVIDEALLEHKSSLNAPPPTRIRRNEDWRLPVQQAMEIAEGLHAAHQFGVIHRDVKPSNILIDANNKAWITDFGLARMQADGSVTRSGDVVGTMKYMSPEQARGDAAIVDGRADVYSLGATLYERLTLQPAHQADDTVSILRQIDAGEILPIRRYRTDLPRDLETVITKAMSASRDDRYETAQTLADDLGRVLAGEPTIARPPTHLDRCVRLASRHRGKVAVAGLMTAISLFGLIVGTTLLAAQKRASDRHAAQAERNEQIARDAIDRLGTQMAERLAGIPSAYSVRRRLLSETLDYYERLAKAPVAEDEERSWRRQLDLAMTHGKIGEYQGELGEHQRAIDALQESEAIYARLASLQPTHLELQLQWAICQNNLAQRIAQSGELDLAAAWFAKSVANHSRLQSLLGQTGRLELAKTLNNLGVMLTDAQNVDEARSAYRRAIEALNPIASTDPIETEFETPAHSPDHPGGSARSRSGQVPQVARAVPPHPPFALRATIQANYAGLIATSDPEKATELAYEALRYQLDRLEADSGDVQMATEVVSTLHTLAKAYMELDQMDFAIDPLNQAVDISEKILTRWPDQPSHRRDLVISLDHLGRAYSAAGQLEQAYDIFQRAQTHGRFLVSRFDGDAEVHSLLGGVLNNLAFLIQRRGDDAAARECYADAIEQQQVAVKLAPNETRYQDYLQRHQHNLRRLGVDS